MTVIYYCMNHSSVTLGIQTNCNVNRNKIFRKSKHLFRYEILITFKL